jgi:hypothetical protein
MMRKCLWNTAQDLYRILQALKHHTTKTHVGKRNCKAPHINKHTRWRYTASSCVCYLPRLRVSNTHWTVGWIYQTVSYGGKGKVELCPDHFIMACRRWRFIAQLILNFCTRRRLVVSFTSQLRHPDEGNMSKHYLGGWASHRASLDDFKHRKSLTPAWNQTPDHPAYSLVTTLTMPSQSTWTWRQGKKTSCTQKLNPN